MVTRRELEQAVQQSIDERMRLAMRVAELSGGPVAEPDPADFTHRDTYPAFDRLLADADGNLWVRAYPAPEAESHGWSVFDPDGPVWVTRADPPPNSPEGTRFDIFEPGGRRVGELELGFPFTLHQVRSGRIYGVARDELGVERVYSARVEFWE